MKKRLPLKLIRLWRKGFGLGRIGKKYDVREGTIYNRKGKVCSMQQKDSKIKPYRFSEKQTMWIMSLLEENARLRAIEKSMFRWMLRFIQGYISLSEVETRLRKYIGEEEISRLYEVALKKPRHYRNRATTIIFYYSGIPKCTIAEFLNLSRRTVRKYIRWFEAAGVDRFLDWSHNKTKKFDDEKLKEAVFAILHAPPISYDINRATWRIEDIHKVMSERDLLMGHNYISKIIKDAGYRFRKAKTVLTSTDPCYKEKLKEITRILSKLKPSEKFFSIDEFGPVAIAIKGGRSFVAPGEVRVVPQWQISKGCLIVTAALELSTNQVAHFYSEKKNTDEMIKLLNLLLKQWPDEECIYLSWDCASWHVSNKLYDAIEELNSRDYKKAHKTPMVKLAPLPACSQFLNVIESVFSGMARAVIHNSDYQSVGDCKKAINRYFSERNQYFKRYPKRAGKKIWGDELVLAKFNESNNCKPLHI